MKIEDQVVTLELAKELKELGVKQDGVFSYYQYDKWGILLKETREMFAPNSVYNKDNLICSAYTVAELGEMLLYDFYSYYDEYDGWTCSSPWGFCNDNIEAEIICETVLGPLARSKKNRLWEEAKTEADARAKMLAFLIKEGYVDVEKVESEMEEDWLTCWGCEG